MFYLESLKLEREPFDNSPNPDLFYPSRQHMRCLQSLEISIRLKRGISVVIGPVGTGKSTLCRKLMRRLGRDENIETRLMLDPGFRKPADFLAAMARLFDLPRDVDGTDVETAFKELLKNFLFDRVLEGGKTIVLVIDEGQKLAGFSLEILRELLNFETNDQKLLQIVVFAQQELMPTLEKNHANLLDRVNYLGCLEPLTYRDVKGMVLFRLTQAASDPRDPPGVFTNSALKEIHSASGGYPRQVVNLCHQALLAIIVQKRGRANRKTIRACRRGRVALAPARRGPARLWLAAPAGLTGLLFLIGLYGLLPEGDRLWSIGGSLQQHVASAISRLGSVRPGGETKEIGSEKPAGAVRSSISHPVRERQDDETKESSPEKPPRAPVLYLPGSVAEPAASSGSRADEAVTEIN